MFFPNLSTPHFGEKSQKHNQLNHNHCYEREEGIGIVTPTVPEKIEKATDKDILP
jgi:hypothetical protein